MIVMSDKYPCFCEELRICGYSIIPTDTINNFLEPEQKHTDMQILKINDNIFLLDECTTLKNALKNYNLNISSKRAVSTYPDNVQLNFLYLKNELYGRADAISPELKNYCDNNKITVINVSQGYCRCSTLVVDDNSVITSDPSIDKMLSARGVEVLKISSGSIILDGFDYGFIGGASAKIKNDIIFFGNIKAHPNYTKISDFIYKHNLNIKIICEEMPLTDIGGIIIAEQ